MSEMFGPCELDRRTLLRRAAAGMLATPAAGLLGACAGGDGDDGLAGKPQGEISATNPLGADPNTPVEIVVNGVGTRYASKVGTPAYNRLFPRSTVNRVDAEEIATVVWPRFTAGNPPDMVHNSGSAPLDQGALVRAGQVQDLTALFAAPSVDTAGRSVRDTLVPGTVEQGTSRPYVLNYALTVSGLWYSAKLFADNGWTAPTTWTDFTALLGRMKARGITPYGYAGSDAAHHQYLVILTSAAKIGGADVLRAIDNLEDGAWQSDAVRQAAQAWGVIGAGYSDRAFLDLRHTQVQRQHNRYRLGVYPSGSWLEKQQAEDTPSGFDYQVMPVPGVTTADRLPATAIYAAAGEQYLVASGGQNPRGGMEYLRHMLSRAGARGFTELTGVLTVVAGATDGLAVSPGLASATRMLSAAGPDHFAYRFDTWYRRLAIEARAATNELMFQGGSANGFCSRMQEAADAVRRDDSIEKFTR